MIATLISTHRFHASGRIDGMVVATSLAAARQSGTFLGETPLVREATCCFSPGSYRSAGTRISLQSPLRYVYAADIQKKGAAASIRDRRRHLHTDRAIHCAFGYRHHFTGRISSLNVRERRAQFRRKSPITREVLRQKLFFALTWRNSIPMRCQWRKRAKLVDLLVTA